MNYADPYNTYLKKVVSSLEGSPNYINTDGLINTEIVKAAVHTASDILNDGGSESIAKSSTLAVLVIGLKKYNNLSMDLERNATMDSFMASSVAIDAIASNIEIDKVISLVLRTFESKGYRFTSLDDVATATAIEQQQFEISPLRSILKNKVTTTTIPAAYESTGDESTNVNTHIYPTFAASIGPNDSCMSFRDAIMSTVQSDELASVSSDSTVSTSSSSSISKEYDSIGPTNSCMSFRDAILSTIESDDLATVKTEEESDLDETNSISSNDDYNSFKDPTTFVDKSGTKIQKR